MPSPEDEVRAASAGLGGAGFGQLVAGGHCAAGLSGGTSGDGGYLGGSRSLWHVREEGFL